MTAYYNEIDPYAAQWLRNLIAAGHIAQGDVDERSIRDVTPADLAGYTQCHFFAGVGVWSYALRLAGWPDDRPVWTGSCPCQPFSSAGRGDGAADPRHLWPTWIKLIRERRPDVCFGEQVASRDGLAWLDLVYADLEAADYAVGALDLCAAGFGAPHIRQRLYFVGENTKRLGWRRRSNGDTPGNYGQVQTERLRDAGRMADANGTVSKQFARNWTRPGETKGWRTLGKSNGRGNANGYWSDAEWIACRDGKARATKPGLFPLAHGASARVGRLRAYGNAIVAPQAAEFIRAYMSVAP